MKRLAFRLLLAVFSAGWIAPLSLAFVTFYDFIWRAIWPMAAHHHGAAAPPFHLFSVADDLFYLSMVWLSAAIIYWVVRATR